MMPPPPALPLTADERLAFVRWIDLGAPIDSGNPAYGWHLDDLRPTLEISAPRAGVLREPQPTIRVGIADANSGIAAGSLSITADVTVAGRAPGMQLADLAVQVDDGVFEIALASPLHSLPLAQLFVSVRDVQGNITRVTRRFSIDATPDDVFRDGFEVR